MKIAIDIDDTITETSDKIEEVLKQYNPNYKEEILDDQFWKKFYDKHIDNIMKNVKLIENAKEVIDKLKLDGHEIYFLTARSNDISKNIPSITLDYFKKHGLDIDNLYFHLYDRKGNKCRKLSIDLLIDDNIDNCLSAIENEIKVILFRNTHDKLLNIDNWLDIYKYIKENFN